MRIDFEHKNSLVMKNATNKLRKGKDKGGWLDPEIGQGLEQHFCFEKF